MPGGRKKRRDVTLHMIGHGHIDPVWLWRWQEGAEEVRATFRSALERMRETEGFIFTASSAAFYKWIKEVDPEMFEEIRARVREGRWDIAGGWWVEPDCNIPLGESFVRHGLYSQRFFQEEFGRKARVGFNPDSFGHAGTLPQILKKQQMEAYVFARPDPTWEMSYKGTTFRWRAKDGSEILGCLIPHGYGCGDGLREKMIAVANYRYALDGQRHFLCFYGVGNHGGGPTKRNIEAILEAMEDEDMPEVKFSRLEDFVDAFLSSYPYERIPLIEAELQHHARGCYSAHSGVKRWNRRAEHSLMIAERLATVGGLAYGASYPDEALRRSWQNVLFNQFHDVLAGTSIESAYEDVRDSYGEACQRASETINFVVQRIANSVDTRGEGTRFVFVFNPLPWKVSSIVTTTQHVRHGVGSKIAFVDENGEAVPSQDVPGQRIGHVDCAFLAELPPFGYRCYRAVPQGSVKPVGSDRKLEATLTSLENDFWRMELDPYSGFISRLYDKSSRVEVLEKGAILAAMVDDSDTWSHGITGYRVEDGRFGNAAISVFESGDVRATLRVISSYSRSTAESFITLYRDLPYIDLAIKVNWQERYRALKLSFETRIGGEKSFCDAPYGYAERELDGHEQPCQQWVELSGRVVRDDGETLPYGLAVINDGKYGYDATGSILRMTLLRSPSYAHHDNGRYDASSHYPIIDQGVQWMRFRIIPHAGSWQDAGIPRRAWEFNEPAIVHQESAHGGKRLYNVSYMAMEPENIIVSVLKRAEGSDDLIVRGYEAAGRDCTLKLSFPFWGKSFEFPVKGNEIKTIRIDPKSWSAREVDLLEE